MELQTTTLHMTTVEVQKMLIELLKIIIMIFSILPVSPGTGKLRVTRFTSLFTPETKSMGGVTLGSLSLQELDNVTLSNVHFWRDCAVCQGSVALRE